MSWRDLISIHPAADLFPLLGDAELRELADDIYANALHEPVKIWLKPRHDADPSRFDKVLIDGRNRLDAMELAGLPISEALSRKPNSNEIVNYVDVDVTDIVAYVVGVNIRRRHLTGEQKRNLIAELLKMNPERSNLQTAKIVGVDDKTVASVRREMESRSEIPSVGTRVDTKGRQQPASKPKPESPPAPALQSGSTDIDDDDDYSPKETAERARNSILLRADEAKRWAFYDGDVDAEIVEFVRAARDAWDDLTTALERRAPERSHCVGPSPILLECQLTVAREIRKIVKVLTSDDRAVLSARLHNSITDLLGEPAAFVHLEVEAPPTDVPPPAPAANAGDLPDMPAFLDRRSVADETLVWKETAGAANVFGKGGDGAHPDYKAELSGGKYYSLNACCDIFSGKFGGYDVFYRDPGLDKPVNLASGLGPKAAKSLAQSHYNKRSKAEAA